MDLGPPELFRAQDLLRKLDQMLSLFLPQKGEGEEASPRPSFADRIFVPPSEKSSFTSSARPLDLKKILRAAQGELLRYASKVEPSPSVSKSQEGEPSAPPQKRGEERKLPPSSPPSRESSPLREETQNLVYQVRVAVQALSPFSQKNKPPADLLQRTMSRLKPFVDAMIAAIERGEMPSFEEGLPPQFQRAVPLSSNEPIAKKKIPRPFSSPKEKPLRPHQFSLPSQDTPEKSPVEKPPSSHRPSPPVMKEKFFPSHFAPEEKRSPSSPHPEQGTIPGAPFTPSKPPFSEDPQKKKKRKIPWSKRSKEEEEEKDR